MRAWNPEILNGLTERERARVIATENVNRGFPNVPTFSSATMLSVLDEFEGVEDDPAERDPAEAEPTWRRAEPDRVCGCGDPAVIVNRDGLALCIDSARMAGLEDLAHSLNPCPIHGAGCEAWA